MPLESRTISTGKCRPGVRSVSDFATSAAISRACGQTFGMARQGSTYEVRQENYKD